MKKCKRRFNWHGDNRHRKVRSKFSLIFVFVIICSIIIPTYNVYAESDIVIDSDWLPGKSVTVPNIMDPSGSPVYILGEEENTALPVEVYKITKGGIPLYSLEPGKEINKENISGYANNPNYTFGLTEQQKSNINLYSYFGYGSIEQNQPYSNELYIATQCLIWEELGYSGLDMVMVKPKSVSYSWEEGTEIQLTSYKNDIKSKVNNYKKILNYTPQFFYLENAVKGVINVEKKDLLNGIIITEQGGLLAEISKGGISTNDPNIIVEREGNDLRLSCKKDIQTGEKELFLNVLNSDDLGENSFYTLENSPALGIFQNHSKLQKSTKILLNILEDSVMPKEINRTNVRISTVEKNKIEELQGANLKLVKGNSDSQNVIKTWKSGEIEELSLDDGEYTLIEEKAPNGFKVASPITFTIAKNKIVNDNRYIGYVDPNLYDRKIDHIDNPIFITSNKDDLVGTVVYCYNVKRHYPPSKNSEVSSVEYKETLGTAKALKDNTESSKLGQVELKDAVLRVVNIGYPNNATGIQQKYNLTDGQFRNITQRAVWYFTDSMQLPSKTNTGEIYTDNEINAYEEMIRNDTPIPENLELMLYIPADGDSYYQNLLSTQFIKPETITMVNERLIENLNYKFEFSKIDINGQEIAGAEIQILKQEDKSEVESWTSVADQSHGISLEAGNYIFHEENAPDGYKVVTDIEFTVSKDGSVKVTKDTTTGTKTKVEGSKMVITDEKEEPVEPTKHDIQISKQNLDGQEIAGAEIQILKQEDKSEVESWTSVADQSHGISLEAGNYIFHEENAPDGYKVVTDIEFTVSKDGSVKVTKDTTTGTKTKVEGSKMVITDEKEEPVEPTKHDIQISKQNLDGQEIEGAQIQILNQEDKSEVESWTSVADQSHSISLESGNYIFHEESAPEGYKVVTDIEFTVSGDGNVTVTKDTTTGTKTKVEGSKIIITDERDESGKQEQPKEEQTTNHRDSSRKDKGSPNTGAQYAKYIILNVCISIISIIGLVLLYRRKI